MTDNAPIVRSVKRRNGVAGQVEYTATVEYPNEPARSVTFVGSVYGGPVVMISDSGAQTFVREPGRFGDFGEQWVRRFFGES